jgi:hypothetical protein
MQGDNSNPTPPETSWQFKPGDTVSPGQSTAPAAVADVPAPITAATEAVPVAAPQATPSAEAAQVSTAPSHPEQPVGTVTWTASEFIAHTKSTGWYLMLALVAIAIAALVWLVTKDKISTTVILVAALALGGYGARKPRQLQYVLNDQGLEIGSKYYAYDEFGSFSIMQEGAFSSIVFVPLKRFAPLTTIYYAPEDEDKIVDILSERLPMEERHHDAVDRLMHRIRF